MSETTALDPSTQNPPPAGHSFVMTSSMVPPAAQAINTVDASAVQGGIDHQTSQKLPPLPAADESTTTTTTTVSRSDGLNWLGPLANSSNGQQALASSLQMVNPQPLDQGLTLVPQDGSRFDPLEDDCGSIVPIGSPVTEQADTCCSTGFLFLLLSQMEKCSFTDMDRMGKHRRPRFLILGYPGIACKHCHTVAPGVAGGRFFPTSLKAMSDSTKTMDSVYNHLKVCQACPQTIKDDLERLQQTHEQERDKLRHGSQRAFFRRIWKRLHGVDAPIVMQNVYEEPPAPPTEAPVLAAATTEYSQQPASAAVMPAPPQQQQLPPPGFDQQGMMLFANSNQNDHFVEQRVRMDPPLQMTLPENAPLVTSGDEKYATSFLFLLLSQFRKCVFTESDRIGKRSALVPGFAGLACRNCQAVSGSLGRFFPASLKTLSDTSKTIDSLHNHMKLCHLCPQSVKDSLAELRETHDDERGKMRFGSQKGFFLLIWRRLHGNDAPHVMFGARPKRGPRSEQQQQPDGKRQKQPTNGIVV